MKGDFSRLGFQNQRQYDRVLMQQGRVQLDSDWNAQSFLDARRVRQTNLDLIGGSGASVDDAGFDLRVRAALEFTRPDQYAEPARPEAFAFGGREHFTISAALLVNQGGVVLSNRSTEPEAGWSLTVNADLTVSFERVEHQRHDETVEHVWEERIGDTTVIVITEQTESETIRTIRRVTTTRPLTSDEFHDVLVRCDDRSIEIRIDGEVEARDFRGHRGEAGRQPLRIGAGFSGQISDLRFWRAALDSAECRAHRRRHHAGHSHRLACFPFDDGTGDIARDVWGNGHDAKLHCASGSTPSAWIRELWIDAGRYYVEGVPCSLDRAVRYTQQPGNPGAAVPPFDGRKRFYLAYLESWDRLITTLEDPSIAEPALGGVDTGTRIRTVAAVGLMPLERDAADSPEAGDFPEWRSFTSDASPPGRLAARVVNRPLVVDNQLLCVEIHQTGWALAEGGSFPVAAPASRDGDWWKLDSGTLPGKSWASGDLLIVSVPGKTLGIAVISATDSSNFRLQLSPNPTLPAGASRLCLTPAATYKWSRNNASTAFPVTAVDSAHLTLENGADDWEIARNDWVEVGDDTTVLRDEPGTYAQIIEFDRVQGIITIDRPLTFPFDATKHPFVRRWERALAPLTAGTWLELDQGVQVNFSAAGKYRTADYWTIPLRSIPQNVEWPVANNEPVPLPPEGIQRRRCLLALVVVDERGPAVLRSFRRIFQPLTEVTATEHEFVKRSGDEMTGSLTIDERLHVHREITAGSDLLVDGEIHARDGLHVAKHLHVHGRSRMEEVEVSLLRGRLAGDIVGTPQIQDGSVTKEKLAFPIDGVAHGFLLLRASRNPVSGYRCTGPRLVFANPQPAFPPHQRIRHDGSLRGIVRGHHAFLFADNGDSVWSVDLRDGRLESRRPPEARRNFALAELNGMIYLIGGIEGRRHVTNRVSVYDPDADFWADCQPMRHRRFELAAVGAGGFVNALGGRKRRGIVGSWSRHFEQYDPNADRWSDMPPMPTRRSNFAVAAHKDGLFAMGGEQGILYGFLGRRVTAANEVFDSSGQWLRRHSMPERRRGLGLVDFDGVLCALGGDDLRFCGFLRTPRSAAHQQFDPALDAWSRADHMRFPRKNATAAVHGNLLLVVAGSGAAQLSYPVECVAAVYYGFEPERVS